MLPKSGVLKPFLREENSTCPSHILQWWHHQWPSNQSKLNWCLWICLLSKFSDHSFYWYGVIAFSQSHMILQLWHYKCPSGWSDLNWCCFLVLKSKFGDYCPCCKWVIGPKSPNLAMMTCAFQSSCCPDLVTILSLKGKCFFKGHMILLWWCYQQLI